MPAGSILVADDDTAIRTVLNQALSRAGYEVRLTGNAATLYRGTVHISWNSAAALPADYTFTAADAGKHSFTLTAPKVHGTYTVTIKDTAVTSTGAPISTTFKIIV